MLFVDEDEQPHSGLSNLNIMNLHERKPLPSTTDRFVNYYLGRLLPHPQELPFRKGCPCLSFEWYSMQSLKEKALREGSQ